MKTYSSKSAARKGAVRELAKAMNISKGEVKEKEGSLFTIEPHETEDGKFFWRRMQTETAPELEVPTQAEVFDENAVNYAEHTYDDLECTINSAIDETAPPVKKIVSLFEPVDDESEPEVIEKNVEKNVEKSVEKSVENPYQAQLDAVRSETQQQVERVKQTLAPVVNAQTIAENTTSEGILRKSAIESPCKFVWESAARMYDANDNRIRSKVVNHCVEHGVALHTARTQYQKWFTAHKNSKQCAVEE